MSTKEWGVGYDEGYMKGWNDAMDEKPAEASNPVAYIEHHKAGDNLVWDNPGANSSALYTSPPVQRKPLTDEAQVLRTLLGAALGALRYHTEQTRPIQRTKETIAAIEYELAAHGIKGDA